MATATTSKRSTSRTTKGGKNSEGKVEGGDCLSVIVRQRIFDGATKRWSAFQPLFMRKVPALSGPENDTATDDGRSNEFVHDLPLGGQVRVYCNQLDRSQQEEIADELTGMLRGELFRQYTVQNGPEPRTHFLLHEHATGNFDEEAQPGYRYGCTRMKARPVHDLPSVARLAAAMEDLCHEMDISNSSNATIKEEEQADSDRETFWSVGINPVMYRDGRDKIGYHADDDQGEEIILTALIASPEKIRVVRIKPLHFKTLGNLDQDVELELLLGAGDVYVMDGACVRTCPSYMFLAEQYAFGSCSFLLRSRDLIRRWFLSGTLYFFRLTGAMQVNYVHCVPVDSANIGTASESEKRRIAIVFRRGRQDIFEKDTGKPCRSLWPRVPAPIQFGQVKGLEEGKSYTRVQLMELRAHRYVCNVHVRLLHSSVRVVSHECRTSRNLISGV
jgi:alkylated DNA repair dioxygenase AlkB